MERKNPLGLIRAFKTAFGDRDDTMLLLKVAHSESYPADLDRLKVACSTSNVRIFGPPFKAPADEHMLSMSECFVSLHRSERFGIPIAEAMLLEKPVIATAYSANMDFTTPANSLLVKYKLTEIDRDYGPYRKGWVWADPDLDHTADLCATSMKIEMFVLKLAGEQKNDILQLFHAAIVGRQMHEHLRRFAT